MYQFTEKNVFETNATTLVNAVNTVGVMGAGIALEFKKRFPKMYQDYHAKCIQGKVQIGQPYLYENILNFPTKQHWCQPSQIQWIEQGLLHFANTYQSLGITSIAFPKLGCGKGGLEWEQVKNIMVKHFEPLTDIEIHICLASDLGNKAK